MTKAIIVRDDGTVGPSGLKMIQHMASEHKTQRTIAAALNIPLKKLEKMMEANKGDNEVRLAWERGFAEFDQHVTDTFRGMALGDVIETYELDDQGEKIPDSETDDGFKKVRIRAPTSKAQTIAAIFFAKAQMGWTEKPSGPLVQDNRIQITVPDAMKFGEFMKAIGQTEIVDARKDKTVPLKDITPQTLELEPPKAPD